MELYAYYPALANTEIVNVVRNTIEIFQRRKRSLVLQIVIKKLEKAAMWNKSPLILLCLLTGCAVTEPEPYQSDRAPEDRTEYNGVEGALQQQRDQNHLMSKELADKCDNARVDLAVAESQGDIEQVEKQRELIDKTCR